MIFRVDKEPHDISHMNDAPDEPEVLLARLPRDNALMAMI